MRQAAVAAALALLLVVAGCSALGPFQRGPPDEDRLGWEDGRWYDDDLRVTTADGLNASEREAVVARTMARVEQLRRLEFEKPVPVEVISRAEYRERSGGGGSDPTFSAWNDQVWEALFLVGEDATYGEARGEVFGSSVQGYYAPARDEIVIVSDSPTPQLDTRTLAHELVHALQDQHYSLGGGATQDAQLAGNGLTEGSATHVESLYRDRCEARWSCFERPGRGSGGGSSEGNFGVFLAIYAPYAEGPEFVAALRERGPGWSAVNDAYADFPASTEQVIHPATYPDETPATVRVRDRSSGGWHRFDLDRTYDTVGEASIYAMFRANGQVDRSRSPYDYAHPLSAGWAGDRVVPYTNGSAGGYVWTVEFDTRADAREFHEGYVGVLEGHDARQPRSGTYVIPDGPFADAFRVERSGKSVTVVNAPTRGDLDDVHGRAR